MNGFELAALLQYGLTRDTDRADRLALTVWRMPPLVVVAFSAPAGAALASL